LPEDSTKDDWKLRYLDSVAEFDSRERKWGETEALLRQGLSRLSLAVDGLDPALDRHLEELRRLLREGAEPASLRGKLEQIAESVRHLDDRREQADPRGGVSHGLLGRLFGKGAATAPAAADAERRRLRVARNLLQELVESLLGQDAGADLLRRIGQATSEVQVYNLGHELVTSLQPSVLGSHGGAPRHGLRPHEVLLRLLEYIEVPSELGGRYEDIRQLLLGAGAADHTEQALMAIADLVAEIRGRAHRDRTEIESFLKQVTERLNEIDAAFQESLASQREG
jgi:diguanylate cyclase